MFKPYAEELRSIEKIEPNAGTERLIRDRISVLTSSIHSYPARSAVELVILKELHRRCLLKLRSLQNRVLLERDGDTLTPQRLGLRVFLHDMCAASDLALCSGGLRVDVSLAGTPPRAVFELSSLQTALYDVISTLAQYAQRKTVISASAVAGEGGDIFFRFSARLRSPDELSGLYGSDALSAASHAARLHGGSLFCGCAGQHVHCSLRISGALSAVSEDAPTPPPDLAELMCDRLSPMYVGLSNVCAAPI